MVEFNERLRELRLKNKLTQKEVAAFLGITESAYGYYEQGRNEPSLQTIKKLAQRYDVSISYILSGSDSEKCLDLTNNPEIKEFIKDILHASKEEQEELKLYWEFMKQKRKDK